MSLGDGISRDSITMPDWMLDPIPRKDLVLPPTIPMPVNRQHAEMMLVVAQRYLDDNPE